MGEGGRNLDGRDGSQPPGLREDPAGSRGRIFHVRADKEGGLKVPPELARDLGLEPGAELEAISREGVVEIRPSIHSLARVYIEPTARCNLACETCVRNTWQEPMGDMEIHVFERLLAQFGRFPHLTSVMFGGFGEPTAHPSILAMIRGVKGKGLRAEMVTNGTLLDREMAEGIVASGLDTLWVSFDGASEASYEAIREGANYAGVIGNVRRLLDISKDRGRRIEIGIAFVVMKKNIDDLRRIDRLIEAVGASRVSVSNVLPYSAEMEKQMVCSLALSLETFSAAPGKAEVSLPRLDINNLTRETIFSLLRGYENLSLMGNPIRTEIKACRFIRERCTIVRWDGQVSPCMGLLHAHKSFLNGNERTIEPWFAGDVATGDLYDIWHSSDYREFRDKVDAFDFAPCHACGGCNLVDSNAEDCLGSVFPACGGCLWAQGVIQCP
jgi:MoaA/NifB/PqqE/SkfB family radical SAM enzyme